MTILASDDGEGLRRRVIEELRASPPLWREYRRRRQPWWKLDIRTQRFFALLFLIVPLAAREWQNSTPLSAGPRVLEAILIAMICGRTFTLAVEIWGALYNNAEFGVTCYMPVRPQEYFRYQLRKILFRSLWVPLLSVLTYTVLSRGAGRVALLVFPLAILHWVVFFAMTLFVVRYGRRYLGLNSLPGYAFYTIAAMIGNPLEKADRSLTQFRHISSAIPPAWIDAGFRYGAGGEWSLALLLFLPSIALAATAAWNYDWLKKSFLEAVATALPGFPVPAESEEEPVEVELEDRTDWSRARAELHGLQAAQSIESGALATRMDWAAQGPIERCAAWWFTDRERVVAEFLLGEHVGWWSQRWKQSAVVAAMVVAGALSGVFTQAQMLLVMGGIVSMMIGCPVVGGYWIAFSPVTSGGLNIPLISMFPAGFREVSGVIVKTGVLRLAAWAPLGLLIGTAIGSTAGAPEKGSAIALALLYCALAAQPLAAALRFAEGVNDSSALTLSRESLWRSARSLVTVSIVAAFVITALVLVSLAVSDAEILRIVFALILPLLSLLFWGWYAYLFHRGGIDQLIVPRR